MNVDITIAFFALFIGFIWGKMVGGYLERLAWNKLIEEGKIPKPSNSKKSPVWGRHYE